MYVVTSVWQSVRSVPDLQLVGSSHLPFLARLAPPLSSEHVSPLLSLAGQVLSLHICLAALHLVQFPPLSLSFAAQLLATQRCPAFLHASHSQFSALSLASQLSHSQACGQSRFDCGHVAVLHFTHSHPSFLARQVPYMHFCPAFVHGSHSFSVPWQHSPADADPIRPFPAVQLQLTQA